MEIKLVKRALTNEIDIEPEAKKARNSFTENSEWMSLFCSSSLKENGKIAFFPQFLDKSSSDYFFNKFLHEITWLSKEVVIYGRRVMQPRKVAFTNKNGLSYKYSGQTLESQKWIKVILYKFVFLNLQGIR